MAARMIETRPGDVIITMNEKHLLKFTGWVEAHRPPGEWEPGFLGNALRALETAREGIALGASATCFACGRQHDIGAFYDFSLDGWACLDDGECNERRIAGGDSEGEAA